MGIPQLTSNLLTRDVLLEHIKQFLDSFGERRTQTRGTYEHALKEFLRWYEQDGMCRFAVDDVLRYRDYLSKLKKLAPASVATYLNGLRQFCEHLLQRGVLEYNPARFVRSSRIPRPKSIEVLTSDEVDRLIDFVDQRSGRGKRDLAIIRLMVQWGLSEAELVRADVRDYVCIDGRGALKVERREDESAVVLIPSDMTWLVNDYLTVREGLGKDQPLFLSDGTRVRGVRMTIRGIRERVHHYLTLAGIKSSGSRRITPKALKHTAAMLMAQSGASADEIKYRMRFGTLAKAMRYVHQQRASLSISSALPTA
jgi:site-specific recombinase XerD